MNACVAEKNRSKRELDDASSASKKAQKTKGATQKGPGNGKQSQPPANQPTIVSALQRHRNPIGRSVKAQKVSSSGPGASARQVLGLPEALHLIPTTSNERAFLNRSSRTQYSACANGHCGYESSAVQVGKSVAEMRTFIKVRGRVVRVRVIERVALDRAHA